MSKRCYMKYMNKDTFNVWSKYPYHRYLFSMKMRIDLVHNTMNFSFVQIDTIKGWKIFVTYFTSVLLSMYANHMSSITWIILQLFSTNMTRESFDITMGKHVLFQTVWCKEPFATQFTYMFSACLIFIMFASFVSC